MPDPEPSARPRPVWLGHFSREAPCIQHLFDSIASVYDPMNLLLTLGFWRYWQQSFIRFVDPRPGMDLLDVACGTGELTMLLARRVTPRGRVTGLDLSESMLAVAGTKISRAGLTDSVNLRAGDALSLPFPDSSFDGASIGFALRNVADLRGALREMRRVVRPGGWVVSMDLSHPDSFLRWPFYLYLQVVPLLGRLFGRGRDGYAWLPKSLVGFPRREELAAIMEEVGLVEVESRPVTFGMVALHRGRVPG